jgi:hypothetical protein
MAPIFGRPELSRPATGRPSFRSWIILSRRRIQRDRAIAQGRYTLCPIIANSVVPCAVCCAGGKARKLSIMSQFSDTIRPRYRRRTVAPPTDPAANRAEQSTRILIRVPLIQLDAIAAEGSETRSQESGDRGQGSGSRDQGSAIRLAGRPTASGDAAAGVRSQESGVRNRESASTAQQLTPSPTQTSLAAPVKDEPAAVDSNSIRTVRIDQGHVEATLPHLASPGWMSRQSWLPRLLERNSLLATAAIIVVVVLVVVRLNHRNSRSDPTSKQNTSNSSPSVVDQKSDSARTSTMKSPSNGSANSRSPAERSASERSHITPKLQAENPTAGGSPTLVNPGRLKGVRAAGENESPPGPASWNLPAATNTPAAIEARALQSSASLFNPPPADGASFYSARREAPLPTNTIMPRQPMVTGGAAFENRIEKAPFEVPR